MKINSVNNLVNTLYIIGFVIVALLVYEKLFILNEEVLVAMCFLVFVYLIILLLSDVLKASLFNKMMQIKTKFYSLEPIINKEDSNFFISNNIGNIKSYDNNYIDYYHMVYSFINNFKNTNEFIDNDNSKLLNKSYEDLNTIYVYNTLNTLRIELIVFLNIVVIYVYYIPMLFQMYIKKNITNRHNDIYVFLLNYAKYKENKYFIKIYKSIIRELLKVRKISKKNK